MNVVLTIFHHKWIRISVGFSEFDKIYPFSAWKINLKNNWFLIINNVTSSASGNEEVNRDSHLEYDYVYLAHPRAVTSISWRQISKFMQRYY